MKIRTISIIASAALMVAPASAQRGVPRNFFQQQGGNAQRQAERRTERQAQRQAQQQQRQAQQQQLRPAQPPASVPRANPANPNLRAPGPHPGNWLRDHENEPLPQQEQALRSDPGFQRLPPQRQQQLLNQLQNFNNRTPEQREQMLNRMGTLERFTPEQRKRVREVWEQFRDLPMERRQRVHQIYQRLLCMSPSERQAALTSDRFRNNFNDQERGIINGALNFGVPVSGGAQPNCAAEPQSFNALPGDLFGPDMAEYWAALQAPSFTPAVVAGGTTNSAASLRALGNGFVADSGSSGSARHGVGSARLTGTGNTGGTTDVPAGDPQRAVGPNAIAADAWIQQTVADVLQRLQVECPADNSGALAGNGAGLLLGGGEPRLLDAGMPLQNDLQSLLARALAEPDGEALVQQVLNVLATSIQSRQDERADPACMNQAMQQFAAEIERALGVRHTIAAGGDERDAALLH